MASEWDGFSTGLKERLLLVAVEVVVLIVLAGFFAYIAANT